MFATVLKIDFVLYNGDTVAKDTTVLYFVIMYTAVAVMHTAVIYTVDNYT